MLHSNFGEENRGLSSVSEAGFCHQLARETTALTFLNSQLPQPRHAQEPGVGCVCKETLLVRCHAIVVGARGQRRDECLIHPFPVITDLVYLVNDRNNSGDYRADTFRHRDSRYLVSSRNT